MGNHRYLYYWLRMCVSDIGKRFGGLLRHRSSQIEATVGIITMVSVVYGVGKYWSETPRRTESGINQRWQVLLNARDQPSDAGRSRALEYLWSAGQDLDHIRLHGAFLKNLTLEAPVRRSLEGWSLVTATLTMPTFSRVDFNTPDFRGAVFRDARFDSVRIFSGLFGGVSLGGATLFNATDLILCQADSTSRFHFAGFRDGEITGGSFRKASFGDANFANLTSVNSDFSGARFESAQFSSTTFAHIDGERIRFNAAVFESVTFTTACVLRACDFSNSTLTSVRFETAQMDNCVFYNSTFSDVQFVGTALRNVDFSTVNRHSSSKPYPVTFIACDLRRQSFADWQLDAWSFVACTLR